MLTNLDPTNQVLWNPRSILLLGFILLCSYSSCKFHSLFSSVRKRGTFSLTFSSSFFQSTSFPTTTRDQDAQTSRFMVVWSNILDLIGGTRRARYLQQAWAPSSLFWFLVSSLLVLKFRICPSESSQLSINNTLSPLSTSSSSLPPQLITNSETSSTSLFLHFSLLYDLPYNTIVNNNIKLINYVHPTINVFRERSPYETLLFRDLSIFRNLSTFFSFITFSKSQYTFYSYGIESNRGVSISLEDHIGNKLRARLVWKVHFHRWNCETRGKLSSLSSYPNEFTYTRRVWFSSVLWSQGSDLNNRFSLFLSHFSVNRYLSSFKSILLFILNTLRPVIHCKVVYSYQDTSTASYHRQQFIFPSPSRIPSSSLVSYLNLYLHSTTHIHLTTSSSYLILLNLPKIFNKISPLPLTNHFIIADNSHLRSPPRRLYYVIIILVTWTSVDLAKRNLRIRSRRDWFLFDNLHFFIYLFKNRQGLPLQEKTTSFDSFYLTFSRRLYLLLQD